MLCYIRQGQLRILDLHGSATDEIVVNIRLLLDEAIPGSRKIRNFRLRPLNISNNIVSCLFYYKPRGTSGCDSDPVYAGSLVVFSAWPCKVLTVQPLQDFEPKRLAVRNSEEFLFLFKGGRSETLEPRAVIWGCYEISAHTWKFSAHFFPNFQPFEIGATNCFEIFDNHAYMLSNHSELEEEEYDWVSPYHCRRIPFVEDQEEPDSCQLLRRNHLDGPMDHRWTFMRMFEDEATGEIKVVESRKEWIKGSSSTTRTYYTTKIAWPCGQDSQGIQNFHGSVSDGITASGSSFGGNSISPSYPGNSGNDPRPGGTSGPRESASYHQQINRPPRTLRPRDPLDVHPGDDSSKGPILPRNKCPVLSYHPSCQTFLDLVDLSPSYSNKRQMRLRGGTRRRRRPEEVEEWSRSSNDESSWSVAEKHFKQVYNMYKHEEPVSWPPEQDTKSPNSALAQLYEILSLPQYAGEITGDWDERSFVYAAGATGGGKDKALVFISFDPSISLKGTLPYPGSMVYGRPQSVNTNTPATTDDGSAASNRHVDEAGSGGQTVRTNHASMGKSILAEATQVHSTKTEAVWCTIEPAQYRTIKKGFHFCV